MSSRKKAVTGRFLIVFGMVLAMATALLGYVITPIALADDGDIVAVEAQDLGNSNKVARTIMIYMDGGASEANTGVCSTIIKEYLHASFNRNNFRVIVMTGGSSKWHLESQYLRDKDSDGTLTGISNEYNQVWEVYGAQDETEGYLRLLDGDGVSGDGGEARTSANELMYGKDTLKNFINYAKQVAPAEKYDLILNDHGSGPAHGYGSDDHGDPSMMMSVLSLRQALAESAVVGDVGKFDFVDVDSCFNGNFEIALALSDYTDYFLGSADVDPFATVDYTALFNYLNENPTVDTKTFGKHLVDLFADYYNEHPEDISVGNAIVFCVVDTQKLKESDIVSRMQAIAEELRAQATTGSFYDEIRTTKDDYHFAYHNHQDLWTLAEQLGLNVYETDWSDPELRNAYTDAALEVQRILSDEDVIYSRYANSSRHLQVTFGRELDGSVTVRSTSVPEGGLSLFHTWNPTKGSCAYDVRHYVNAMPQLAAAMGERTETTFYTTYPQAVIDYELIYEAGIAVSRLAEAGTPASEIDYDKVAEYVVASENERAKETFETLVARSDRDVRAWLGQIIDIQKKEVLDHEKTSLAVETRDGVEGYRIDVHDTPRRTVGVPVLRATATVEGSLLDSPTMTFYGQAISNEGDARVATDSSYFIPKFDGQWYAVRDSAGETHVASAASDHSVYASISIDGSKHAPGELGFDSDGKAKYVYVYGNTKPFELADLDVDAKVDVMMHTDPFDGISGATSMPFEIDADNTTLIKDTYANLGITGVELKLAISDMYEVEHEIKPSLSFDPSGGTWADGGSDVREYEAGLETEFEVIDAPKRNGYTFVCWKGSEYQPGDKYLADSDHAFTAQWKTIRLNGSGHVQGKGDVAAKESGEGILIGTTGESRRLEQITMSLPGDTSGGIKYRAHLQGIGWGGWVEGGKPCGTTGASRRVEAVQMRLSGAIAETHSVWYRVHSQTFGWLGWARDGQAAGTSGQAKRAEAVEVQVLPQGQKPEGYAEGQASYVGAATADVHVQRVGWTGASSALEFGTTGQSRRLEAIRLQVPGLPVSGGVSYEVHAQRNGWMPAADGALAGTTGEAKRLEAVKISLTGDAAKKGNYSVWYRVHSQTYGWLGWAHDGEPAGTTGLSRRAEAIDVQVLPQGQVPRGYDASRAACVNG